MSDPSFNSVTIRQSTATTSVDLLTIDSVDGADGNGASLRFINNSAGALSLALARLSALRVDPSTVRLDLAVAADPSLSSGDLTPPLLSLVKGAGAPSVSTAAGSTLDVGGALSVTGAAALNNGLAVSGDMSLAGTLNGRDVAADGAALDAHLASTANPHATTAAQVGALASTGGVLAGSLQVQGDLSWGTGGQLSRNQGGSLELGDSTLGVSTPFIDFHFGVGAAQDFNVRLINQANRELTLQGGSLRVEGAITAAGSLGVGTNNPTHRFHVVANDAVGLFESLGTQAYLRLSTSEGLGNRVEITNRPGGRLSLWTAGGGDVFNLTRAGSIGVGLVNPRTQLHVLGRIATGLDFNSAGSITFFPPDGFAWFHIDNGPAGGRPMGRLRISHGGSPGQFELMSLAQNGDVVIPGRLIARNKVGFVADTFVNALGSALEQGDVVVIGANQSTLYYPHDDLVPAPEVDLATIAYDTRVCGIVVEAHAAGKRPAAGGDGDEAPPEPEHFPPGRATIEPGQTGLMATLGTFAYCKVDADIAPISPGDLLTTSPTPGHAQKVLDRTQALGAILGKALAGLDAGKGKIPVMVLLQ